MYATFRCSPKAIFQVPVCKIRYRAVSFSRMMEKISNTANVDVCHIDNLVSSFRKQFLAMNRINTLPWSVLEAEMKNVLWSEIVCTVLNQTCLHPVCLKYPPSVKYRRRFLQELIKMHENTTTEPLDELYDALGEVLGLEEDSICHKSYFMPSGDIVTLTESQAVISEGTTGLVTWEAALYLTEWALEHPQMICGRTVLELGSGVGLTGIALCRSCNPQKYMFTDCHPSVLQRLQTNVDLNLKELTDMSVTVEELDWEYVSEQKLKDIGADIVLAADVVYDPDIVDCLVSLLWRILKINHPDVYIASTIRNPETNIFFKKQLANAGVKHSIVTGPNTHIFPYNRLSTTEIINLHL